MAWSLKVNQWIVDTCAGGAFSEDAAQGKEWRTFAEASEELAASDMGKLGVDYEIVPVSVLA